MSYNEELIKLRSRLLDAVREGVVGKDSKEAFEAILTQIMNDAERSRQNCLLQVDNLKKQSVMIEGQANAFGSVINIIYSAINSYVSAAENSKNIVKLFSEDSQDQLEKVEDE
jgi:hypothetical protein